MPVICDQLIAAAQMRSTPFDIIVFWTQCFVFMETYNCAVIMAERRQEHFWRVSPIGHECVHRDACVYVMHACICTADAARMHS